MRGKVSGIGQQGKVGESDMDCHHWPFCFFNNSIMSGNFEIKVRKLRPAWSKIGGEMVERSDSGKKRNGGVEYEERRSLSSKVVIFISSIT